MILLNDCEGACEIFKDLQFAPVGLTYTVCGGGGKDVGEVIILDRKGEVRNLPNA